jgi:hypothetical protein
VRCDWGLLQGSEKNNIPIFFFSFPPVGIFRLFIRLMPPNCTTTRNPMAKKGRLF